MNELKTYPHSDEDRFDRTVFRIKDTGPEKNWTFEVTVWKRNPPYHNKALVDCGRAMGGIPPEYASSYAALIAEAALYATVLNSSAG